MRAPPGSKLRLGLVALGLLAAPTMPAFGQAYPSKPLRMVIPFAAGGPNDFVARLIAPRMQEAFGVPVVIDNRAGAGGNIGTNLVAKATPDGHTLALVGMHFVVNPALYEPVPYDPIGDFAPVTLAAVSPVIIVVHPSFPVHNVRELAAAAKQATVNYGSPGSGTAGHLAGALFDMAAGIRMQQIPYKGAAPAIAAVLGDQVKAAFLAFPPAAPHVKSGKLRALAVTTLARVRAIPDVPTVAEAGFPGFAVDNMYGVLTTAGSPRAAIARLNAEITRIVRLPEIMETMAPQGFEPIADLPDQFASYLRSEQAKWLKVIRQTGLTLN